MVTGRHGDCSWKLRAESSHLQPQTGSREDTVGLSQGFENFKAFPSDILPPIRPYLLEVGMEAQAMGEFCLKACSYGLLLMACSACFLVDPRINFRGTALLAVGRALPHQLSVKKMYPKLSYGQPDGNTFSTEGSSSQIT